MYSNRYAVFVLGFIVVMLCGRAMATTGCRSAIVSLSPCINYVCGNSTTPSYACCMQLADVVKSQPRCLCALVSGGHSSLHIKINETLALELPNACKVHTPPVSRCDGNGSHTVPAGNDTQAVPPKSDGITIKSSLYYSFLFFFVASNLYV